MSISGVQSSVYSAYTPPANTVGSLLKQTDDSSAAVSSSASQDSSSSVKNDSKTQTAPNATFDFAQAKAKGPLGLAYNTYQWAIKELTGYRNELASGTHYDPMSVLKKEMSTLSSTKSSTNVTLATDANIKLDSSAPEVILDLSSPKEDTNAPQKIMDFITQSSTSDASDWINWVKRDNPTLLDDVQKVANQTMGQGSNWLNISAEGLGLDHVGTNTDQIVSKIDQAVSTLNGYCGAMSMVLQKMPDQPMTMSCPWSCVIDEPTISFRA
jgi:hypothetical protein